MALAEEKGIRFHFARHPDDFEGKAKGRLIGRFGEVVGLSEYACPGLYSIVFCPSYHYSSSYVAIRNTTSRVSV